MKQPDQVAKTITRAQAAELAALMHSNDALGKPSALHLSYWNDADLNYCAMAEAGLVRRYARPPRGWSPSRFFGVKITPLGRAAISAMTHPHTPARAGAK